MKKITLKLKNERQYYEEFVMCRKKHVATLKHEYTWVSSGDTEQFVEFPISADVIVARYHHNGDEETEMSIVRVQNGREEGIFYSEDLEEYEHFKEAIEALNQKGFQRLWDCDYAA